MCVRHDVTQAVQSSVEVVHAPALDGLRDVMLYVHGPSVRKLSKIATLLLAKNYILMLQNSLEEMKKLLATMQAQQSAAPAVSASTPVLSFPPMISHVVSHTYLPEKLRLPAEQQPLSGPPRYRDTHEHKIPFYAPCPHSGGLHRPCMPKMEPNKPYSCEDFVPEAREQYVLTTADSHKHSVRVYPRQPFHERKDSMGIPGAVAPLEFEKDDVMLSSCKIA